jgi:hypothetical protein
MAPWLYTLLLDFERLLPDNGGVVLALEKEEKKLMEMVKDPEEFVSFPNHMADKPLILSLPTSGKKIGFLHNCFEREGSLLGIAGFAAISPLRSFSAYGTNHWNNSCTIGQRVPGLQDQEEPVGDQGREEPPGTSSGGVLVETGSLDLDPDFADQDG